MVDVHRGAFYEEQGTSGHREAVGPLPLESGKTPISMEEIKKQGSTTTNITTIFNIYQTGDKGAPVSYGSIGKSVFIEESKPIRSVLENLKELGKTLREPLIFEQIRCVLLKTLEQLEPRKEKRGVYFSDLLLLIDLGLRYMNCETTNPLAIHVIGDAVSSLGREIGPEDVQLFRKQFRDRGINILAPLKTNFDLKKKLLEYFE